ncbi:MAG: hypothetical protein ABR591_09635 [Candidatus Velthaea sp.]
MKEPDLQPLGVGEILDRAVTLFVRRFAPLVLILAVVAAPAAILQYIGAPARASMFAEFQRLIMVPPGHPEQTAAILRRISEQNHFSFASALALLLTFAVGPLAATACSIAAARSYRGHAPSVRDAYRDALHRWIPQLVTGLVFVALGVVLFVLIFVVTFVVTLMIVALSAASPVAAFVVGIPIAIAASLAVLGAGMLLFLAWELASVSVALEEPNPVTAIASGFRRTFAKDMFWRSLLVAAILFAVSIIGSLVLVASATTLALVTHVAALYPIVLGIGNVVLGALLSAYLVVYWYDLRVRREGYDLALAAEALP